MSWISAVKQWNEGKDAWCIPRKGSPAYNEVKAIMDGSKPKACSSCEKPNAKKCSACEKPNKTITKEQVIKKIEKAESMRPFKDKHNWCWLSPITDPFCNPDLNGHIQHIDRWHNDLINELWEIRRLIDSATTEKEIMRVDKMLQTKLQKLMDKAQNILSKCQTEKEYKTSNQYIQKYTRCGYKLKSNGTFKDSKITTKFEDPILTKVSNISLRR